MSDVIKQTAINLLQEKVSRKSRPATSDIFSYKSLRDKIQIVTIAGPQLEDSKVQNGVLIPITDKEAQDWQNRSITNPSNTERIVGGFAIIHGSIKPEDHLNSGVSAQVVNAVTHSDEIQDIVRGLTGSSRDSRERIRKRLQGLKEAGVNFLCVCGDVNSEILSMCSQIGLHVLKNLTLQDGERMAAVTGASIVPHTSFLLNKTECIGARNVRVELVTNGWVDPEDAIFNTSDGNNGKKVKPQGQAVYYLQFSLPQGSNEKTDNLPLLVLLCHPLYCVCKDMKAFFWNQ